MKNLQDNGVVVLWRPIHDFGDGFWWGGSPDRHRRVWKHVFDHFKSQGLNNLLWVLSSYGNTKHRDNWAGPQYVDILALDWCVDWPTFDRQVAGARGLGKPLAISQFCESNGKIFNLTVIINTIRNRAPEMTFFIDFSTGVDFGRNMRSDRRSGSSPRAPNSPVTFETLGSVDGAYHVYLPTGTSTRSGDTTQHVPPPIAFWLELGRDRLRVQHVHARGRHGLPTSLALT